MTKLQLEYLESRELLASTGLLGAYYANMNLSGLATTRIDPTVNFNWGSEIAPAGIPGMPKDDFSIKWTGYLTAPTTGNYTFYVTSDDGDRLYVNSQLVINDWTPHSARLDTSVTVHLTAGQSVPIELDYFEQNYEACVQLAWAGPGIAQQVIASAYLSPISPPPPAPADWFSQNLEDPGLQQLTRTDYTRDGQLTRNDMLGLFAEAEAEDGAAGHVTAAQIHDFQEMLNNLHMPGYVQNLGDKVVDGDPANAVFQGQALGNLSTSSTTTQLEELVGKWFLGTDPPAVASTMHYAPVSGTLFGSGPSYTDVVQGETGDCYFLSALAQVAYRDPSAITSMFINNGDGTYTVRFIAPNGSATYETVTAQLPVFNSWNILAYANLGNSPTDANQKLWVALGEKAYAQLSASGWSQMYQSGDSADAYASLNGGNGGIALAQLTGQSSDYLWLQGTAAAAVVNAFKAGDIVFLGSSASASGGIIADHEYSVVGYNASTGIFTLYNPWGYTQQVSWATIAANFVDWSYSTTQPLAAALAPAGQAYAKQTGLFPGDG